jgi:hypothetical protein
MALGAPGQKLVLARESRSRICPRNTGKQSSASVQQNYADKKGNLHGHFRLSIEPTRRVINR